MFNGPPLESGEYVNTWIILAVCRSLPSVVGFTVTHNVVCVSGGISFLRTRNLPISYYGVAEGNIQRNLCDGSFASGTVTQNEER